MEPANCKLVIFPGAVGFEVVLGMLRVLGVVAALLSDDCCGVVLRLMDSANCELGVAMALLSDDCCGVVLRLMEPANCELVILPGAVGFVVVSGVLGVLGVLRVLGVVAALLFDECCGVEKSCRVVALEVARA